MIYDNIIHTLSTFIFSIKFKIIASLWIVFFLPVQLQIYMLGLLVLLDTITGSIVALKNEYFSASRLSKAVWKIFTYMLLIASTLAFELILKEYYATNAVTMFVIGIIAMTELLSILENLSALGVPIPNMFNSFFKDIDHKGVNKVLQDYEAKRRISKNMDILMNKYLLLIQTKDAIQLLEIKFKLWNKHVISPIINNKIINITSFQNNYNLMVLEARTQLRLIIKHHKNLEDEYQRFGAYSEEQIYILKKHVSEILVDNTIPMDLKNIRIAELHVNLMYTTFNEVILLENHKTSLPAYQNSN